MDSSEYNLLESIFLLFLIITFKFIFPNIKSVWVEKIREPRKRLNSLYKSTIIKKLISNLSKDLNGKLDYDVDAIFKNDIKNSNIFKNYYDFIEAEDSIYGEIQGKIIKFSEIRLMENDVNGSKTKKYNGFLFVGELNKKFNGIIVVRDKRRIMLNKKLKRVFLEDKEFEKEFNVFSNDQMSARYILSTSMIERILKYKRKFRDSIELSFVDSKIYVAIKNKKKFLELKSWSRRKQLDKQLSLEYDRLKDILALISDFKLNEDIYVSPEKRKFEVKTNIAHKMHIPKWLKANIVVILVIMMWGTMYLKSPIPFLIIACCFSFSIFAVRKF